MRRPDMNKCKFLAGLILLVIFQGCTASIKRDCLLDPPVKQALLREDKMNYRAIDDHVYFSKEGSSGGRGFGGGGCGCN